MEKKYFNFYLMNDFYYKNNSNEINLKHNRKINYFNKIHSKNKTFRIYKKNFMVEKKEIKNQNLFSEKTILIKNDGSILENNNINKQYFRKLRKYYPIY